MTVTEHNTTKQNTNITPDQVRLRSVALRKYNKQKNNITEDQQITEMLPMVPKIVSRVLTYLKPPLTFEDLVSAGTVGLVKAARDYDSSHHAEFKTYAYIRIRGAVLDELRNWSFVSANANKLISQAITISRRVLKETGQAPTDEALAAEMGIDTEKLFLIFENARAQNFVSLESNTDDDSAGIGSILQCKSSPDPCSGIERQELISELTGAIEALPQRERELILLYYTQNLNMKEVAEVFGITESRVSQLHASAIFKLSLKLRQWKDDQ